MNKPWKISDQLHPCYSQDFQNWFKWRLTYEGGPNFVKTYINKFSTRETDSDFLSRKTISYCCGFAKAAINDIKNAIFQRTCDIVRAGGTESYQKAINSLNGGVDLEGSSMNAFIGCNILPELLPMKRVGVFVDMPRLDGETVASNYGKRPYLYTYRAEDILNWKYELTNNSRELVGILLKESAYSFDNLLGLPIGYASRYRYVWKDCETGKIWVQFYEEKCDEHYGAVPSSEKMGDPIELKLPKIPFVLFEIPESLLKDAADMQIALTNIASSDLGFISQANYPIYVEQYDGRVNPPHFKPVGDASSTAGEAGTTGVSRDKEVKFGTGQGRLYPKDVNQPNFINPSPEPLLASMKKQDDLKKDIRLVVNLSVANLNPVKMGAESKSAEDRGLENGLSFIGLVLEKGERQIAEHWTNYEKSKSSATINYPKTYSIRSEEDRQREAEGHVELMDKIPSNTFRKQMAMAVASIKLGGRVTNDTLEKIVKEIEDAPAMVSDYAQIHQDFEDGFVTAETASSLRGYDAKTEVPKAIEERAERIKMTMEAQGGPQGGGQARGNPDAQTTQPKSKDEKAGKPKRGPAL